mmetsp:Transcript_44931/g.97315  ORF Transcript_44931/g.97315 Transcript_44931/m.97315 type:complete len:134 (+) Transcript_44931:1-402(+)
MRKTPPATGMVVCFFHMLYCFTGLLMVLARKGDGLFRHLDVHDKQTKQFLRWLVVVLCGTWAFLGIISFMILTSGHEDLLFTHHVCFGLYRGLLGLSRWRSAEAGITNKTTRVGAYIDWGFATLFSLLAIANW